MAEEGEHFRVTLTVHVPRRHPGGAVAALQFVLIGLLDALRSSAYPLRIRVERVRESDRHTL